MFALLLFPPFGSLAIASPAARANVGWMLLLGIPSAFLLAGSASERRRQPDNKRPSPTITVARANNEAFRAADNSKVLIKHNNS